MSGAALGLLVAAGAGERLGVGVAKAFVEVAGQPLLAHAARALASAERIDALVVVVAGEDVERAGKALAEAGVQVRAVVQGGVERHESVARGLEALGADDSVVAVHDAARPLATSALVSRTVGALVDPWAAVAPALPVVDTLKLADAAGRVIRTVDRRGVWAVQTPQVFPVDVLRSAHARIDARGLTDDLALVERAGGRVRLVEGEHTNVKVTYPDDLELVAALLAARAGGQR